MGKDCEWPVFKDSVKEWRDSLEEEHVLLFQREDRSLILSTTSGNFQPPVPLAPTGCTISLASGALVGKNTLLHAST